MRVLLLNQPFFPDEVATAQLAKDAADELVRRGHDVTVIASRTLYGGVGASLPARELIDGIRVFRVGVGRFGRRRLAGRLADSASYYVRALALGLRLPRFDVALSLTTPPFIATASLAQHALRGTRLVYWVMDAYPDVLVSHGIVRENGLVHRALRELHRVVLRRAHATVVLGRCMKERLVAQGADPARLHVIAPWPAASHPGASPVDNQYRHKWNVGDRLLLMYAGSCGHAHDLRTALETVALLREDDRIRFAFVGGGSRRHEVDAFVRSRSLRNCVLAGRQPRHRLAELLSAADAHFVTLANDWCGAVVPSKFYGVAAAGRPTVFVGPRESEIARAIEERRCGLTVDCGDPTSLASTLGRLAGHRGELVEMGRAARRAATNGWSKNVLCGRLCDVVESAGLARKEERLAHEPA